MKYLAPYATVALGLIASYLLLDQYLPVDNQILAVRAVLLLMLIGFGYYVIAVSPGLLAHNIKITIYMSLVLTVMLTSAVSLFANDLFNILEMIVLMSLAATSSALGYIVGSMFGAREEA